jgi:cytochrome-b5 reductase
LDFKGPFAKIEYKPNQWEHVAMIAGGTGITPMWQVIDKALSDPVDKTKLTLVFANVSPDDILLKPELDALAKANPDRFKLYYTVDKGDKQWKGLTGYVNEKMLKSASFPAASDKSSIVFVCGNEPMMKAISGPKAQDKSQGEIDPNSLLGRLGFPKEQVYKF